MWTEYSVCCYQDRSVHVVSVECLVLSVIHCMTQLVHVGTRPSAPLTVSPFTSITCLLVSYRSYHYIDDIFVFNLLFFLVTVLVFVLC